MNAAVNAKHDAIILKLDTIAQLRKDAEIVEAQREEFLKEQLGHEAYLKYCGYEVAKQAIQEAEKTIAEETKEMVLAIQETVKGAELQAVVNSGRVTWDSKGLEGYAVANPAVLHFRKVGEASVTIRANTNKKEK